jgi:hypothetical protein
VGNQRCDLVAVPTSVGRGRFIDHVWSPPPTHIRSEHSKGDVP